ncbi:nucleolar protein [Extremus antarcticus]|uniref:Nucleolar protein n=1 Tax=Extremus antarcticus TaxID=702011 RepID=A0AAJ0DJI2_9PEZI|nr:nucleolar protein [Extremus antarcticus]
MSTQTITKKRKSADGATTATKKVKTTKSADRPAPGKSALKTTKTTAKEAEKVAPVKSALKKTKSVTEEPETLPAVKKTKTKMKTTTKETEAPAVLLPAVKKTKAKDTEAGPDVQPAAKKTKTKSTKHETTAADKATKAEQEEPILPDTSANTDLTPDQTAALLVGFSSDEEDDASEDEGITISSLPKAPTTGAVQKLINQANKVQTKSKDGTEDLERTPGVVYIGRIPHGFYEHQMRAYFSQFGAITNLRLMRNKKTGKPQHHGFIEFASAAVAEIVCKTMDKYLLFNHILQVRRVPREQVNENMWRGSSRRARNPAPRNKLEGSRLRRGATREVWEARVQMEEKKRAEKAEKLKEMGYEFEMPVLKGVGEVPVRPKAIEGGVAVEEAGADEAGAEGGAVVEAPTVVQEGATTVIEQIVSKKRPASGKTQVKKAVKKVKA